MSKQTTIISRQDSIGARIPADLERRYGFGKSFAELMGISTDARTHAYKAESTAEEANATAKEALTKVVDLDAGVISQLLVDVNGIHTEVYGEGGIMAKLNLALVTDEEGNLQSVVNIGANKMTITTDYFQLLGNGSIIANYGSIGGWSIGEDILTKYFTVGEDTYQVYMNASFGGTIEGSTSFGVHKNANPVFVVRPNGHVVSANEDWSKVVEMLNGYLHANNALIEGSTFTGKVVAGEGEIGGWDITDYILSSYNNGSSLTIASAFSSGTYLFKADHDGIQGPYGHTGFYVSKLGDLFSDTLRCSSGTITASDINFKNTIADLSDKYGVFFDSLRAVTHKYNNGKSDRLHAGFIAQEVDEALTKAGLTRQEFAGICIENQGTENEFWSLRYTEFIPLLVREVQKLKKKVEELQNGEQESNETD